MRATGATEEDRRDRGNYAVGSQVMNQTYDYLWVGTSGFQQPTWWEETWSERYQAIDTRQQKIRVGEALQRTSFHWVGMGAVESDPRSPTGLNSYLTNRKVRQEGIVTTGARATPLVG